jgi:hypothetical protein
VLVILGYSIPFFNREVDRFILEEIYQTSAAIYIQDKFPDDVAQRVSSIWHGSTPQIHLIEDVKQFYLPPQL